MDTGLQLGSLLLHIGSQMMDLTWSNKDQSYKAVSIFETVIFRLYKALNFKAVRSFIITNQTYL